MKNVKKVKIAAIVPAVLAALVVVVSAAYDSSEDPLVSLSYLRNIFKQEIISAVEKDVDEKIGAKVAEAVEDAEPAAPASSEFDVLELKEGMRVLANGACEIMLRSGSAVCVAPDGRQGLADYTDATEILIDQPLTKNHMCMIPRGDGRGIRITSEIAYIMVRGAYTVVDAE